MAKKERTPRKGTQERDASRARTVQALGARQLLGHVSAADLLTTAGRAEGGALLLSPQDIVDRRRDAWLREEIAREVAAASEEVQRRRRSLQRLAEKEGRQGLNTAETRRRDELQSGQGALEKVVDRGVGDLQVLDTPGASRSSLNDVRARRDPTRDGLSVSRRERTPLTLNENGWTSGETVVTDQLSGGQARTLTQANSRNVTLTSLSDQRSTSSKIVTADGTSENTITHSRSIDASTGDPTWSSGTTQTTKRTDASGDVTSSGTTTSTKVNAGGYTATQEKTETVKDQQTKNLTSTSINRSDGQVSRKWSKTNASGTVDSDGNTTKGTSHTGSFAVGIAAKEGEAGVTVNGGRDLSQTHRKGVTTDQSLTLGGKVLITCEPVPNSTPPKWRVGLLINLAGGLTLGRKGAGKASEEAFGRNTAVSASLKGDVTARFTRVMSEQDTERYLGAARNHTGGAERELKVIHLAAVGAMQEAHALLLAITTDLSSAESVWSLGEGERREWTKTGSAGVTGSLGGSSHSGGTASINLGYSRSGKLLRTVERKDGTIVLTVALDGDSKLTGGGSVGQGIGSVGGTWTSGSQESRSVTFTLNPLMGIRAFDAAYSAIIRADSEAELAKVARDHRDLVTSTSLTVGESADQTSTLALGPAKLEITESTALKEALTTDKSRSTRDVTGAASLGASMSVPMLPKVGAKTTDTFTGRIGPDRRGTGDASTARSGTDLGKSLAAIRKAATDAPVAMVIAAVTGSGTFVKERVDAIGTKLTDSDYDRLYDLAHDKGAWTKAFSATVNDGGVQDWYEARERVLGSGGDRTQIAQALGWFQSRDSGRGRTIRTAVNRSGGGIRYEFPDDLAAHKAAYEDLVVADPRTKIDELAAEGKAQEAGKQLTTDLERLDRLAQTLRSNQPLFTDAGAYGEMLRRVTERAQELRAAVNGSTSATSIAPAGSQQEAVLRAERQARLTDLTSNCEVMRQREQATFAAIDEDYERWWGRTDRLSSSDTIRALQRLYGLQDLYKQWDLAVAEIRQLLTQDKTDPATADRFAPDRTRYKQVYDALKW